MPMEAKRGHCSPGTGIKGSYDQPYMCWEPSWILMPEQEVLLTTKPPLQHQGEVQVGLGVWPSCLWLFGKSLQPALPQPAITFLMSYPWCCLRISWDHGVVQYLIFICRHSQPLLFSVLLHHSLLPVPTMWTSFASFVVTSLLLGIHLFKGFFFVLRSMALRRDCQAERVLSWIHLSTFLMSRPRTFFIFVSASVLLFVFF